MPSIVIPAHNEERSIARLLEGLEPLQGDDDKVDVVIVCNGCTDATAEVARRAAPWATVIDLPQPSKPAALNAADAAVTTFPRLYLDADVEISADAVRALFRAVESGLPAAGATPSYDLSGCSRTVRAHYRIWMRLPANNHGISGTNAMAVSQQGRARFTEWPALIGDDYFLDGQFTPQEKQRVPQAQLWRPASRRFADCVSRKARIHQGNLDVAAAGLRAPHGGGGLRSALAVVRAEPRLAVDLPAHLLVTVSTRLLSWWRRRRGTQAAWYRDSSRA